MAKGKKISEHWSDVAAKRVIQEKGEKKIYCCAAGITPSGTIHIGNFREIITVDLVQRSLQHLGKKTRFIYSWDDFDVFRKVPKNMPMQEELKKYLRKSIVDVPDPFKQEESYARHHEVQVERDVKKVGIFPEYLYQSKKYRAREYVTGIRIALQNSETIQNELNKYRDSPLSKTWLPIRGYCPDCNTDEVEFSNYDGKNKLDMNCKVCKTLHHIDISKSSHIKLPWRVDWPMRWAYEKVDFEPGGKDHSTHGSSYTTGKEIVKIFNWTGPSYQMYDFVIVKGIGGKMASSSGNVITLGDCLEIYEPSIIRYLFAGTRPKSEFSISFDIDVLKVYSDFDKLERIFYGQEECSETKLPKFKREYELSCVTKPSKLIPVQISIREITNTLQVHEGNIEKVLQHYSNIIKNKTDKDKIWVRAQCAKNWLEKYAPEDYKFSLNLKVPSKLNISTNIRSVIKEFGKNLSKDRSDEELHEFFYDFMKKNAVNPNDAFKSMYLILISKEKGPRLASFINTIGNKRVMDLLSQL
jgi:lysyl-tRNA synthetase, class I